MQQHDRDTNRFAMKCSSITVNGKERDVFKDPITDHGKHSKPGRLDLIQSREYDTFQTIALKNGQLASPWTAMKTVYENGEVLIDDTFDAIRARVQQ